MEKRILKTVKNKISDLAELISETVSSPAVRYVIKRIIFAYICHSDNCKMISDACTVSENKIISAWCYCYFFIIREIIIKSSSEIKTV